MIFYQNKCNYITKKMTNYHFYYKIVMNNETIITNIYI